MNETTTFGTIDEPQVEETAVTKETAPLSVLDALAAEAKKDMSELHIFDVTKRPGWQIQVNVNIDHAEFERYTKIARGRGRSRSEINALQLASLTLAGNTVGIYRNGQQVMDSEGEPLTFANEDFLTSFGVDTAAKAAAQFLTDGPCIAIGNAVMELAGYAADDVQVHENPTKD